MYDENENELEIVSNGYMYCALLWFNDKKSCFVSHSNQIFSPDYQVKFIFDKLIFNRYTPTAEGIIEIGDYSTKFKIIDGEFKFDNLVINLEHSYSLIKGLDLINMIQ